VIQKEYTAEVEGLGTFTFRTYGAKVQLSIESETRRVLGGSCESISTIGAVVSLVTLERVTVAAPDGWDLDLLDMNDESDRALLLKVYGRMNEERKRFRGLGGGSSVATGTGS
jgi:hypothetical protein